MPIGWQRPFWILPASYSLCYGTMDMDNLAAYQRAGMLPADFTPLDARGRERMRQEFEAGTLRKVIATDVWATGVDFEQLQIVYSVSGRESEIWDVQGPGRVSRVYQSKEYGEVVDLVDHWDHNAENKSRARARHYKALGWEQDWPTGRRRTTNVA
jgi:superfamily II DNA/RNA helicase